MARRFVAGVGQLLLAILGFVLVVLWFVLVLIQFYGQINGSVEAKPVGWVGLCGAGLFLFAWLWAWVTSLSLMRAAKASAGTALQAPPPLP
jgi:hypothetical protein